MDGSLKSFNRKKNWNSKISNKENKWKFNEYTAGNFVDGPASRFIWRCCMSYMRTGTTVIPSYIHFIRPTCWNKFLVSFYSGFIIICKREFTDLWENLSYFGSLINPIAHVLAYAHPGNVTCCCIVSENGMHTFVSQEGRPKWWNMKFL